MLHFLWRFLVYRENENRKRCALLSEVTQKDPRNIENFKIKTPGKMFCIACAATKWSLSMMQRTQIMILCYNVQLLKIWRSIFFLWNKTTTQPVMIHIPIDFIGLPSVNKIQLLIGDHGFYFNENIGIVFYINVKKHWRNLVHIRDQYLFNSYEN